MVKKIKDMFFKGKNIRGEVGIEIEMEGAELPLEDLDSWYSREDGSLRGDIGESREYVLIRPCKREDTMARLSSLSSDLKENGSKINASYRTGVHIHTNVREMTFNQVFTFIFSYYMFEDALMAFAGADRVGNLFCLRVRDAEGVTLLLENVIKTRRLEDLHVDRIRYSSMNLKAIKQYGSVEFRGLPFNGDFQQVETWITLLHAVKDFSLTLKDPKELVALLSNNGGEAIAKQVFGDLLQVFPKTDWNEELLSSIRLVQRLVYLIDWEDEEEKFFIVGTKLNEENPEIDLGALNKLQVKARNVPMPIPVNPILGNL